MSIAPQNHGSAEPGGAAAARPSAPSPPRLFRLPDAPEPGTRRHVQQELPLPWTASPNARRPLPEPKAVPVAGRLAERTITQVAVILTDVLAGSRPPQQLTRWTTGRVRDEVARRVDRERRGLGGRDRAQVLSQHSQVLSATVVEACAIARIGVRVRALALRLEYRQERWIVTRFATDPGPSNPPAARRAMQDRARAAG